MQYSMSKLVIATGALCWPGTTGETIILDWLYLTDIKTNSLLLVCNVMHSVSYLMDMIWSDGCNRRNLIHLRISCNSQPSAYNGRTASTVSKPPRLFLEHPILSSSHTYPATRIITTAAAGNDDDDDEKRGCIPKSLSDMVPPCNWDNEAKITCKQGFGQAPY